MKAGLLGGTFDPIHLGHLICADFVREQHNLDKIIFLPASTPPHKLNTKVTGNRHRLTMLRIAVEHNPYFEVNDYEITKGGISYTIDTVRYLKETAKDPDTEFYLIIGADNLVDFNDWKEPDKLLNEIKILVLQRPGIEVSNINERFKNNTILMNSPLIEISSSDIRRRVKERRSIKYVVLPAVEKYIYQKGLYI